MKTILVFIALTLSYNVQAQDKYPTSEHSGSYKYGAATLHYNLTLSYTFKDYSNGYSALLLKADQFQITSIDFKGNQISAKIIDVTKPELYISFDDTFINKTTNAQYSDIRHSYPKLLAKFDMSKTYVGLSEGAREKIGNPTNNQIEVQFENLTISSIYNRMPEVTKIIEQQMRN